MLIQLIQILIAIFSIVQLLNNAIFMALLSVLVVYVIGALNEF